MSNYQHIMKVYFNNSCKICRAEIDLYKKENISEISWVDITNNQIAKIETNKDHKQLLRRLHVKKDGKIFSGAKAFLLVVLVLKCLSEKLDDVFFIFALIRI